MTTTDHDAAAHSARSVIIASLMDEADEMDWNPERDADAILAALHAAGYQIVPRTPEPDGPDPRWEKERWVLADALVHAGYSSTPYDVLDSILNELCAAGLIVPRAPEVGTDALKRAHEYALCFAEYRRRTGHRPYSTRNRFDGMTDDEVERALDNAKSAIARAVRGMT